MPDQVATFAALRAGPLNKGFLSGPVGTRYQRVLGLAMDREIDRFAWARRARWPDWAPSDGLVYIGAERSLERVAVMGSGAPEAESDWRGRLRRAWTIHQLGGSARFHADSFLWCGLRASVRRRKDWASPPDDAAPSPYVAAFQRSVWSQFDVLIDAPLPWTVACWGDGRAWGSSWTWGSSATPAEVDLLRRLLRRHAAGHDTPTWIVVNASGGRVWGSWTWGEGTWSAAPGPVLRWLVGEEHWQTRGLAP